MIVQQKICWNLNMYLRTLIYIYIFNWSVYPLISSTKSRPWPELELELKAIYWVKNKRLQPVCSGNANLPSQLAELSSSWLGTPGLHTSETTIHLWNDKILGRVLWYFYPGMSSTFTQGSSFWNQNSEWDWMGLKCSGWITYVAMLPDGDIECVDLFLPHLSQLCEHMAPNGIKFNQCVIIVLSKQLKIFYMPFAKTPKRWKLAVK